MRWFAIFSILAFSHAFELSSTECTLNNPKCQPDYLTTSIMSERDMSYNISIDQLETIGIDLTTAIFDTVGYTDLGLTAVEQAVTIGYRSLYLDAYFAKDTNSWGLCPTLTPHDGVAGKEYRITTRKNQTYTCTPNVTIASVFNVLSEYIVQTDTDLAVNIMTVQINLHDVDLPADYNRDLYSSPSNATLSQLVEAYFSARTYTPKDLLSDRANNQTYNDDGLSPSGYPSLNYFLLTAKKRILAIERNVSLSEGVYNINADTNVMFVIDDRHTSAAYFGNRTFEVALSNTTTCNITSSLATFLANVHNIATKSWRTVIDVSSAPFTNQSLDAFVDCGFNPVINTQIPSIDSLVAPLDAAMWSWDEGEPQNTDRNNSTDSVGNAQPVAFQCAQLDANGWKVGNCYEQFRVLCRNSDRAYDWTISDSIVSYFDASAACPDGTEFSVPRSSLQQTAAILTVQQFFSDGNKTERALSGPDGQVQNGFPVWIDLNSISTTDCWVTGGPYAMCPYHQVKFNRNQVALLASAVVVAFVLIVMAALLQLDIVPMRRNQARWRKLVNQYNEEEYEGVPA